MMRGGKKVLKVMAILSTTCLLLLHSESALGADDVSEEWNPRTGPPRSPISFTSSLNDGIMDETALKTLTEDIVGSPCDSLTMEFGSVSDESSFGIDLGGAKVWHISGAKAEVINNKGDRAEVAIDLVVDDNSGRLLAASTVPKEVWVLPAVDDSLEQSAAEIASTSFRLSVGELSKDPKKSLGEVLSELWNHGISPGGAGQVVIRPRTVLSQWPPVDIGDDGIGAPNSTPFVYWIVEVLGTFVHSDTKFQRWYHSKYVLFLNDELANVWFDQYAP